MGVTIEITGGSVELMEKEQLAILHKETNELDDWLLTKFFPRKSGLELIDLEGTPKVFIGSLETSSPIAPLVAPTVEGKIIYDKARYNVESVQPPYLKPSHFLRPTTVHDIALLGKLTSDGLISSVNNMSLQDKLIFAQIYTYNKRQESIHNFKILQARDILFNGKTTFASADFPAVLVDYGRDDAMNYSPLVKWDDPTATPVTDINRMIEIMLDKEGVSPSNALTSTSIINKLKHNKEFKDEFVHVNGANAINPLQQSFASDKPTYHGSLGGIQFWSWDKTFTNVEGEKERYVPKDSFRLIADTAGHQVACGLMHFDAFNQPLESFDYIIPTPDPSGYKMITEASPLIVPSMRNGVVGGEGFIAA